MSRFFASASSSESEEDLQSDYEGEETKVVTEKRRVGLFEALSISEEESSGLSEGFSEIDEEEEEGEGHEEEALEESTRPAAPTRKSRFLFESESESSEEESTQRQIKSQREKLQEELENLSEALEAGLETQDWITMEEDFDRLIKLIAKHQSSHLVPISAYCVLPTLELALSKYAGSAEFRSLAAVSAKAFSALRQKIRKVTAQYASDIERAQRIRDGEDEGPMLMDSVTLTVAKAVAEEAIKSAELTPETILKRLHEILSMRGRRHVDKTENVAILRKMIAMASNRRHIIHALVALVATQFEMASVGHLGYFTLDAWSTILGDLLDLVGQLEVVGMTLFDIPKEEEELSLPSAAGLRGSLVSYTQRLDDEFTRALQNIDPHSAEYPEFLRQEARLYSLLDRCRLLIISQSESTTSDQSHELVCQIIARQLEHIYYKPRELVELIFKPTVISIAFLCSFIYKHGNERQQVRALLCHIYWLAIHNEYNKARSLMIQSYLQDSLHLLDIPTQILYNRALVQVGLAAFRASHLKEAYFALQELCSTGRPKELLAQGLVGQKYTEKGDMDRAERQRLIPFHMQINVEMIDCIFLVVAMLLELPQNAAANRHSFTGERRLFLSRHLRRIIDAHDRNLFNGPPENTREYIVAATKGLANGEWRLCEENMMKIKIWDQMPNPDGIRTMLKRKIREAALLCFLYQTGPIYANLNMQQLEKDFELPMPMIITLIKTLINEYGMQATLSKDEKCIKFSEDLEAVRQKELNVHLMNKLKSWKERNLEGPEFMNTYRQLQLKIQRIQESSNISSGGPPTSEPSVVPPIAP